MSDRVYWLNAFMFGHESKQEPPALTKHKGHPFHEGYGGECPGVYYIRLQRDGWRLIGHGRGKRDGFSTFEKPLPKGWILRKTAHATINHPVGVGCYYDTHEIIHSQREQRIECVDWEWSDLDGDRLVWVSKGVLYGSKLTSKGLSFVHMLYDFNPLEFEPIEAPY